MSRLMCDVTCSTRVLRMRQETKLTEDEHEASSSTSSTAMMNTLTSLLLLVCLICLQGTCLAFGVPSSLFPVASSRSTTTTLWGKVKRGKLGREVDAAAAAASQKNKQKTKRSAAPKKTTDANVSPALAEWMASKDEEGDTGGTTETTSTSSSSASTYTSFDDDGDDDRSSRKKKKKPVKQSARKAAEDDRDRRVRGLVEELQDALEGGASVDAVLGTIRQILELPPVNFKQLSAGAARQDFRLAWVGSDDAVSHVGTGLHKVALARLQEVFLSFCGRNRVEMQEVIRILGPFPNVKNTLQGQSSFTRDQENGDVVQWRLTWDSMVDGTGKEILAGKDENVQRVDLQVYFSSTDVVVAVVPPDADNYADKRADPLEDQGKHVLVFVREDNLMDQLEALRVA